MTVRKRSNRVSGAILSALLLISCGTESDPQPCPDFHISGEYTQAEWDTTWDVYEAFVRAGYDPRCRVVFVRSPGQRVLDGTPWIELRTSTNLRPRNPAEGYRGYYADCTAHVRRYGESEP